MVPVIYVLSLLVFSNCLRAFMCIILEEASSGTAAMQTNLNAACGVWSEHWWLTPHPFNLCSNAGNTHMSISQTQPLDMTLSTCTQLLWLTMARPVLSGACHVKPLYGLGHRAAAQIQVFQSSIAYARLLKWRSAGPIWTAKHLHLAQGKREKRKKERMQQNNQCTGRPQHQ